MPQLKYIPGEQLAYIAASVANILAREFDLEDLNILASLLSAIGDSVAVIASQREALRSLAESQASGTNPSTDASADASGKQGGGPEK